MTLRLEGVARALVDAGAKLGPAMSASAMDAFEVALGTALPEPLRTLYRQHDGMLEAGRLPMRAMTSDECVDAWQETPAWHELGVRAFWTDDNGNYVGLYVEGPLVGRVLFLDHEELVLAPVFRSVESLYRAALEAAASGRAAEDLEALRAHADHPALTPPAAKDEAEDVALAAELFRQASEPVSEWLATQRKFCAMTLLPPSQVDRIVAMARSEEGYVGEYACNQLARRGVASAVGVLVERATGPDVLVAMAALSALGRLEAAGVMAALVDLAPKVDEGLRPYVRGALRMKGFETRRIDAGWEARTSPAEPWRRADLVEWLAVELRNGEDAATEQKLAWEKLRSAEGDAVDDGNDWSDLL
jgi:hypothetical protein